MDVQECSVEIGQLLKRLRVDAREGLSADIIERRRDRFGSNELTSTAEKSILRKTLKQFLNPLVLLLLIAGIATALLREWIDTAVIAIALSINVIVGVFQEERASRAFEKLNASQQKFAVVVRNGTRRTIPAHELVPGDIVLIEAGMSVPADLRIIESTELSVSEAALTGEWVDVEKKPGVCPDNSVITQQTNMAWMGTLVTGGFATCVVAATGSDTQIGKIAKSLGSIEDSHTPLQTSIRRIAHVLAYVVGAIVIVLFALGVARGEMIGEMLLVAIAIAVAAIPQGLPAAVTVVLALGMESILRSGGLVRNLLAAETLGATTIILTDKTGTLTQARMALAELIVAGDLLDTPGRDADATTALRAAIAASDAFFEEGKDGEQIARGRPMERSLIEYGVTHGVLQDELAEHEPRIDFLPFGSEHRFAASLNSVSARVRRVYISAAPEELLARAKSVHCNGAVRALDDSLREQFERALHRETSAGNRLIASGYADVSWSAFDDGAVEQVLDTDIIFAGLFVFQDPVREDVADAIAEVCGAGAQVVMVTGDNPETAASVARAVGIADVERPIVGPQIDKLSDDELYERILDTRVFARVLPAQKLRIARLLKGKGEIVAMTGDGVNDAPALRSANIGLAVGSGTDVAKEAADVVLLDDSFSIIVAAVREGRKIIDNLKKIVAYLLSTSFSEIVVIGGALIFGAPLPILPTQILWANIIEEGLMSFAFAFEKPEPGIMKRDPRSAAARTVLTKNLRWMIGILVATTSALLLGLYIVLLSFDLPLEEIRTIMFVGLSLDAIFFAFSLKSLHQPLIHINIWTNIYLLGALAGSIALLVAAVTFGPLQVLLSTVPLSLVDWLILAGLGLANLAIIEAAKYFIFMRSGEPVTA